ncbi:mucin-5AC-like [Leguminivora glycinivorella]|uniref:mucin-5AC-like n=1 Tax=Leguminivora glycinivorella TaxID=1035111 RepID=UPI00200C856D|nr:mucin-5AC-like [Leguminivora glycinivorella]
MHVSTQSNYTMPWFQIRKGAGDEDFRPTPIPLNEWREVRGWRGGRADRVPTLQEVLHQPAHYWEDALRHSVYLTLVRDKIDQLIAKGSPEHNDLDDKDLWDKIKRAPFERNDNEDPPMVGDVVMMAKGKLMEESGGFRFKEDDKFKDKCRENCMDGVKALWSVKRIRQRDSDVTGRYHYELTFSVITQKKHKKHEKPARTFTVRETAPERIVDAPLENRYYEPTTAPVPVPVPVQPVPIPTQPTRAERALWVHKNIAARNQARQHHNGLDRLWSSLFSDDEDDIPPPRYKPKQYQHNQYNPPPPIYQQYSKAGYVGSPNDNQKAGYVGSPSEHHQKKLHTSHKPHHVYKYSNHYSRPIPPPPQPHHQQHYLDIEQIGVVSAPYHQDHRHGPPYKPGKTPRPQVIPTPPNPVLPQKNFTIETTTPLKPSSEENTQTTQRPDVHPPKTYNKQKPTTVKISYVTDHVRPPVYNAPPGVFVTMDKKPFKPMPPLRLVHSSKLHKPPRPTDFRPSPQVLDVSSFSEPDPLLDTAFRPITVSYGNSNTTEKAVAASDNHFRNSTVKKPPKKNEIVNAQRVTTTAPEIITAHSVEEDSDAEWTNVLGAFAKTTPMAAETTTEKAKPKTSETTTPSPVTTTTVSTTTTTTPAPTTTTKRLPKRTKTTTTTTTEEPTTTPKPKKRTRPPPKFTKPEKVKKHKRITTTTTTTERPIQRKEQDLTPQASSASATAQTTTTTSTTTTTTTTTTTPEPTTTPVHTTTTSTPPPTTTEATTPAPDTEPPKTKSRYRQSTLKYRSVLTGHDKKEEKARTVIPPTGVIKPRRKGTKYTNYITSTPKFSDMQFDDEGKEDHVVSPYKSKSVTTTDSTASQGASHSTTPAYEEVADHVYITSELPEYSFGPDDDFDDSDPYERYERDENQEPRETSEFLPSTSALVTPNETTNEIEESEDEPADATAQVVVTTPLSAAKNKTKCKKKKLQTHNNTTEEVKSEEWRAEESSIHETISAEKPEPRSEEPTIENKTPETTIEDKKPEEEGLKVQALEQTTSSTSTTTTANPSSTPDIFEEIFGGFTFDDSVTDSKNNESSKIDEQESTHQEQFIKAEDDFADFFEAFDEKHRQHRDGKYEDEYEYDDKERLDDEELQFPGDEDRRGSRDAKDGDESYEDYQERPFSLLELMAME